MRTCTYVESAAAILDVCSYSHIQIHFKNISFTNKRTDKTTRYAAKILNPLFCMDLSTSFIAISPDTNAATKPIKRQSRFSVRNSSQCLKSSPAADTTIMGMLSINEKSALSRLSTPRKRAVEIVVPLLDSPGTTAAAWLTPMINPSKNPIVFPGRSLITTSRL